MYFKTILSSEIFQTHNCIGAGSTGLMTSIVHVYPEHLLIFWFKSTAEGLSSQ